ncbi:MAG: isoprenyl transferase [Pirellulaceae bacterium]
MSSASVKDTANPALELPADQLPKHIAMIMDGNGRWAQRNNLPRIEGHRRGTKIVNNVIEECRRLGIRQVTLYCLSSENWKRPQQELDFLMHLLQQFMIESRSQLLEKKIRLEIIGRRSKLPDDVQAEMDKTLKLTREFSEFCLCLAINYGARQEIVDAVRDIAGAAASGKLDPESIDEQAISSHLYTAGMPDPDLLIRTAGEMRVSNYLLWQISYAELWVTDRCWPEFRIEDLHQALRDFASRERRYGGLVDDEGSEVRSC